MEEKTTQEEPKGPKLPALQQKFKSLEQDWQSLTQTSSKTKPTIPLRRCNSGDNGSLQRQILLLDTSPRQLMSSLQHPTRVRPISPTSFSSPLTITASGEVWRVRDNELAEKEIRRERRFGIESGVLKGRRLFEGEDEMGFDGDDEIQSICTGIWGEKAGEGKQGMLCFGAGVWESEEKIRREKILAFESGELKGRMLFEEEDEVGFDGDDKNQSICTGIEEKQGIFCFGAGEGESEEEMRRDRRFVVESMNLKGRRIFEEEDEMDFDGDDENHSICTGIRGYGGCYEEGETGEAKQGMLCFGSGEGESKERERDVVVGERKGEVEGGVVNGYGGRLGVVVNVYFAIALMVFVLCIIGGFGDGFQSREDSYLVPT